MNQTKYTISFQYFVEVWESTTKIIETTAIDKPQLDYILDLFISNLNLLREINQLPITLDEYSVVTKISNKLFIACAISYSNWKSEHPSLLHIFASKLKTPDINLGINLPSSK